MAHMIRQIFLWNGAIVDIPTGFALCDGNNGTPNLTDRFVPGAGDSFAPDDQGGSVNHTHPFTTNGHFHTMTTANTIFPGTLLDNVTTVNVDSGTSDPESTLPPYFALAFIMHLG